MRVAENDLRHRRAGLERGLVGHQPLRHGVDRVEDYELQGAGGGAANEERRLARVAVMVAVLGGHGCGRGCAWTDCRWAFALWAERNPPSFACNSVSPRGQSHRAVDRDDQCPLAARAAGSSQREWPQQATEDCLTDNGEASGARGKTAGGPSVPHKRITMRWTGSYTDELSTRVVGEFMLFSEGARLTPIWFFAAGGLWRRRCDMPSCPAPQRALVHVAALVCSWAVCLTHIRRRRVVICSGRRGVRCAPDLAAIGRQCDPLSFSLPSAWRWPQREARRARPSLGWLLRSGRRCSRCTTPTPTAMRTSRRACLVCAWSPASRRCCSDAL